MERKLKREIGHYFWMKIPMCNYTWALSMLFFFIDVALFFFLDVVCLFFFFFFSFDLLGRLVQYSFFFFFCLFFFWFRCDFLNGHDFYFLINLGDYFYLFTTFFVLTGYHFLIRVYA